MRRRTALRWLGSCSLLAASSNFAQVGDLNDAINKAGRQRMLAERMAKAYLALGQQLLTERSQEIMASSMALFDRQLVELKAFAPTPEVRATYRSLEGVWSDYKTLLVGQAARRENALALIGVNADVVKLAHAGTGQLEQLSGKPVGKLVNIAGRQRMLSQRIARVYLAQSWKLSLPEAQGELGDARNDFIAALDTLAQAPQATPRIREQIELARSQWVFYEAALAPGGRDATQAERATRVLQSSENLLAVMDRVTVLYAQVGGA